MGAVPAAFGRWTRRAFLVSGLARWAFAEQKGALLPSAWHRYSDPATEFEVLRLTDPAHSCWLPAYYNRTLARRGGFLLYSSDDTGGPQACRMAPGFRPGPAPRCTGLRGYPSGPLAGGI